MQTTLSVESTREMLLRLQAANSAFMAVYPGESAARQPVHTLYWPADDFHADTPRALGAMASQFLSRTFPDASSLGAHLSLGSLGAVVFDRVSRKLAREPIEDLRIDFEDGYGTRSDAEEDGHAVAVGRAIASAAKAGGLPPFIGIRLKPFNEDARERSLRTLDILVTTLVRALDGKLPPGFVLTLPKVQIAEQVATLAGVLTLLENGLGLPHRSLRFELMVETTQAVINQAGVVPIPGFVRAADGRCAGIHFGTYDYTACFGVTAAYQGLTHPACDFAKQVIRISLAGTGIPMSDGSTMVLPVPKHAGATLTAAQVDENRRTVEAASRLHYDQVRYSLKNAFYQGWDMHPAQIPTRYAAVFAFYLEGLEAATSRLRSFVSRASHAALTGDVLDDVATGQALLNYFLRGLSSGALNEQEALATGLTPDDFATRSFAAILRRRKVG